MAAVANATAYEVRAHYIQFYNNQDFGDHKGNLL